jgi:outer membrane protein assembly factor BamB
MGVYPAFVTEPSLRRPPVWVLLLLALPLALVVYVRLADPFGDRGINNGISYLGFLGTSLISLTWFVLASGASKRARYGTLGVVLLVCLVGPRVVKLEGWSGTMVPVLRFGAAPERELAEQTGAAEVDLGPVSPTDFPGFGGPDRNFAVEVALDPDWQAHPPQRLWRQDTGEGWSGFAIVNGVAVTMEQRGENQAVTAYGLETGELLWMHTWPGNFDHPLGGPGPRCTPTIDGGRVYALGPGGRLLCLDGGDGSVVWERDLLADYGVSAEREAKLIAYGRANSPLIDGPRVVIPAGGDERKAGLVAYDKLTGEVVWEGPPRQVSFASPRRATLCGVAQILIVNEDSLSGHDPTGGTLLWESPWEGSTPNNASCSDVVALDGDRVLVSKGYGVGAAVLQLRLEDGGFQVSEVWHLSRALRTKFTNAALFGDMAVGLSDGMLEAVRLEDGSRVWKNGRFGHGQILKVAADRLLVLSEEGELILLDPTEQGGGDVLARQQVLEGKTWNQLALAGDILAVRNGREASVWRLALAGE